jgi:hypothetical protein
LIGIPSSNIFYPLQRCNNYPNLFRDLYLRGKKKKKKERKKEKRRNKDPLLHATDLCWETKKEQKKMKLA